MSRRSASQPVWQAERKSRLHIGRTGDGRAFGHNQSDRARKTCEDVQRVPRFDSVAAMAGAQLGDLELLQCGLSSGGVGSSEKRIQFW